MLIIKSDIDLRGDADTRPAPIREPRSSKDSLIIRYEPDTQKLFIDIEVFGRWIAEHTAFNMPELIELLKRDNICEGKKPKSMGKG